jgi:hypothetical protein
MAARKAKAAPVVETVSNEDKLVRLFVILEAFESTEENATSTDDVTAEYKTLHGVSIPGTEIFGLLNELAEAKIIDGERGQWWITVPDVTEANAESIAREYLSGSVETPAKTEARERLEYATRLAESQDGLMSQSPVVQAAVNPSEATDEPFYSPDAAADFAIMGKGEPAPEDTQTGLTRQQIASELPSVILVNGPAMMEETPNKPAPVGTDETERPVFEPTVHEYVFEGRCPPAPMGVPQNLWDMSFEANNSTDSREDNSRAWWKKYCEKLHTEYMKTTQLPA